MRWWLVALLLGGCDSLFNLDHLREPARLDASGTGDGESQPDAPADAENTNAMCAPSYNGQRYQVKSLPYTWELADNYCKSLQVAGSSKYSHLVVITDPAEAAVVGALISASETAWVGLTYVPSQWAWVTTEPTGAIPWATGQPDQIGTQNCGRIIPDVGLDNETCSMSYQFICECDAYPPE
ncbi:MAG TPA: C-type lectin domain-containing protein [Kofleriaceae bacterium]|nr:C-type lectin domain-containing protein [Kofleriaceae bacterium]